MTKKPDDPIDWSLTTWKGSRLQQHREFHSLPFARKLELIEQMSETAVFFSPPPAPKAEPAVREDPPAR
ncbi:MAG TPA: hypothetical protein VGA56_10260 [Opitutaceae bacterium]